MIEFYTMVMIVLSNPTEARNVHFDIFGGNGCSRSPEVDAGVPWKTCKPDFAAQLVIDGKTVGSIPLDGLSEEEIANLHKYVGKMTFSK